MNTLQSLLLASAIIALTACGGSSSNSKNTAEKIPTSPNDNSRYGRVIDGYLENATVCIDSNNNFSCDGTEISLKTDEQGRFNLQGLQNKALLVQAQAGITTDQDDGQLITTGFILRAPATHTGLITPFTSLQSLLLDLGKSNEEVADELLKTLTLTPAELQQDYIAEENEALQLLAKTLIVSIQTITSQALGQAFINNPSQQQAIIESLAWQQITPDVLTKMVQLISETSASGGAKTARELSQELVDTTAEILITAVEFDIAINDKETLDDDSDGILNSKDNCPTISNSNQADLDGDKIGDACDTDTDNDTILNTIDNCPTIINPNQVDIDSDNIGDLCDTDQDGDGILNDIDNCLVTKNEDQIDLDGNEIGDACDSDLDNDSIIDGLDNCPMIANQDQADLDNDNIGDLCDTDQDGDTILNEVDNCPTISNTDQVDLDKNNMGDICDSDQDNDTIIDGLDNCPAITNPSQADLDSDNIGDLCDTDKDGDTVLNEVDNCTAIANTDQLDLDKNGIGDLCDIDTDNDGHIDSLDNCPLVAGQSQADLDLDDIGDLCDTDKDGDSILNEVDNCPVVANTDQADIDNDALGNACDSDKDGDSILNDVDNCPITENQDQIDANGNNIGDVCDTDHDEDGITNAEDNCPAIPNADQANIDNDSLGDACDDNDNRLFAATNIIFDDELDTLIWALPNEVPNSMQQIQIGANSLWQDAGEQPIQLDDRAEGIISIRFKDPTVQARYQTATSTTALTRTPFVKLDVQLNRLTSNALHISEENGLWACTRDNRTDATVYWSADPKFHGYFEYNSRSSSNGKLTALNSNAAENCGFSNWTYPKKTHITSLIVTRSEQNNTKTWGFDNYFEFMRESRYGYHLSELNIDNKNQILLADGNIAELSNGAYLLPMRKVQTGGELLQQLDALKAQLSMSADLEILNTNLNSAKEMAFSAYKQIAELDTAEAITALNNLSSTSTGAKNNELGQAQELARNTLNNSDFSKVLTTIKAIKSINDFIGKNIDNNITASQMIQAKMVFEDANYVAHNSLISNINSSAYQINGKLELVAIHKANLMIQPVLVRAAAYQESAQILTDTAQALANSASTIQEYAELVDKLTNARGLISSNYNSFLENLGNINSTNNREDIGLINNAVRTATTAFNHLKAKYSDSNGTIEISAEDLLTATQLDIKNQMDSITVLSSHAFISANLASIVNLIADADAVSKDTLAIYNDIISQAHTVDSEHVSLSTAIENLSSDILNISDSASAKSSYQSAVQLFIKEKKLLSEIAELQGELHVLTDLISEATQPYNALMVSLISYKSEIEAKIMAAEILATAASTQAFSTYDAAWAQDPALISQVESQINRKPYYKLDAKGRPTYSHTTQLQGWSCVQQADSLFATQKIWTLLKPGSDNQQDGINFIEAQTLVNMANSNNVCGQSDWGLPTAQQLISLSTEQVFTKTDGIDSKVFINHIGKDSRFSGTDLTTRYAYWTNNSDATDATKQHAYSYPEYIAYPGQPSINESLINDDTLDINATVVARLYREDTIKPVPIITELDINGRRALADGSNTVCLRIGDGSKDTVWTKHHADVDNNKNVKGSELVNMLASLNRHNSDAGLCGIINWTLPSHQQFTALAMDKSLNVNHKDAANSSGDYWLNEMVGDHHYVFDIRTLKISYDAKSPYYDYAFRAIGTATGEILDPIPLPDPEPEEVVCEAANGDHATKIDDNCIIVSAAEKSQSDALTACKVYAANLINSDNVLLSNIASFAASYALNKDLRYWISNEASVIYNNPWLANGWKVSNGQSTSTSNPYICIK